MSPLFGRGGGDAGRERTEADREAARLAREARRAEREGRAAPAPEEAPDLEPVPEPDVVPETHAEPEPVAPAPEPEPDPVPVPDLSPPAVTEGIDLTPPPPQVVSPPPRRSPPAARQVPPPPPAPRPIDPAAAGVDLDHDEEPIGVRRVSVPEVPTRVPEERSRYVTPGVPRVPRSRRGARRIWAILALALVAGLIWFAVELFQPFKGNGGAAITVRIPAGAGAGTIADLLAERDVVASSFFFRLRARLDGGTLTSGTHVMRRDMPYGAALKELSHNPPAPKVVRLTIPEGLSRREAAPVVAQAGIKGNYLSASVRSPALSLRRYGAPKGTPSLEGFLFPATYELKPGASAKRLVSEQATAFRRNLAKVSLRTARRKNLTVYDVVTIASMIEREAQTDRDRRLVSAVIYNRLKQRIPLGIDATIRYQLRNWTRPLRVSELQRDTPYNTRLHQGLPPTPVGNPGLASLKAAANPAKVSYLYYVVKPCGNGDHAFSSTDAQFQRDVRRYNDARAKRGGKDPSRC